VLTLRREKQIDRVIPSEVPAFDEGGSRSEVQKRLCYVGQIIRSLDGATRQYARLMEVGSHDRGHRDQHSS
jgi:hypothetical protein